MYLELNNSIWKAEEDSENIKRRNSSEEFNIFNIFADCLEELIEKNPEVLEKYGLNQIITNIHTVKAQEV